MFNKKFDERMRSWSEFRTTLEGSNDPFTKIIEFYADAPMVSIQVDPWDPETWLGPWELLQENKYCEFSKILGICYSLQLTDSFLRSKFQIHICTNTEDSEVKYLLYVDNIVVGFDPERAIPSNELPVGLHTEIVYNMPSLQ